MPELLVALDAFLQEHRRCGELDSDVDGNWVWMAWDWGAGSHIRPRRPSRHRPIERFDSSDYGRPSMDGQSQFIQVSSVALHLHQGTVRETMVTVLYALDSLGNIWKLVDQGGQKWMLMTNER